MAQQAFSIGLFEIGEPKACLYSWGCAPCAKADARTSLDGSSFCFNLFCVQLIPLRWMVRSAYQIGDVNDCQEDVFTSICCPCCTVNQLYQTTKNKRNPTSDGGAAFNTTKMKPINYWPSNHEKFAYNICFSCCARADIMQSVFGMPWWMGCCCVNIPHFRNAIRYQYRLTTSTENAEWLEECCLPFAFYEFTKIVGHIFGPFVMLCCQCAAVGVVVTHIQEEVATHSNRSEPNGITRPSRYLTRSEALPTAAAAVASSPSSVIHNPLLSTAVAYEPPSAADVVDTATYVEMMPGQKSNAAGYSSVPAFES